jgi:hypothetical protein
MPPSYRVAGAAVSAVAGGSQSRLWQRKQDMRLAKQQRDLDKLRSFSARHKGPPRLFSNPPPRPAQGMPRLTAALPRFQKARARSNRGQGSAVDHWRPWYSTPALVPMDPVGEFEKRPTGRAQKESGIACTTPSVPRICINNRSSIGSSTSIRAMASAPGGRRPRWTVAIFTCAAQASRQSRYECPPHQGRDSPPPRSVSRVSERTIRQSE